jgi:hypothetical protein
MDANYKVGPKKIERMGDRQTALLDELEDLMMLQFAGELERYGANHDPSDDLAATWHLAVVAVAKARKELTAPRVEACVRKLAFNEFSAL